MADEAVIKITGDDSGLEQTLDNAFNRLNDAAKKSKSLGEGFDLNGILDKVAQFGTNALKQFGVMGQALSKAFSWAFSSGMLAAITGPIAGLLGALTAGLITAAALAGQEAGNKMLEALVRANPRSSVTLSESQAQTTRLVGAGVGVSQLEATQAQASLQRMTLIRGEMTNALLDIGADFAALTGQEFVPAVTQMGKALSNPIAGMKQLSAAGIEITEVEQRRIRQLQESGRLAEAQIALFEQIQEASAGAGEAATNTIGAQFKLLGQLLFDAFKPLGALILPVLKVFMDLLIILARVLKGVGLVVGLLLAPFIALFEIIQEIIHWISRIGLGLFTSAPEPSKFSGLEIAGAAGGSLNNIGQLESLESSYERIAQAAFANSAIASIEEKQLAALEQIAENTSSENQSRGPGVAPTRSDIESWSLPPQKNGL